MQEQQQQQNALTYYSHKFSNH